MALYSTCHEFTYLPYIHQAGLKTKQILRIIFTKSNLFSECRAETAKKNIAIKLEAPSGDCYNDVTIETDPGVFLTLGGATICRGSELQHSVQAGIPNDHIHYSV